MKLRSSFPVGRAGDGNLQMLPMIEVANINKDRQDLSAFRTSLLSYCSIAGSYPSTAQGLEALVRRPEGDPKPVMWHRVLESDVKYDPWQVAYVYKCPGERNAECFDPYSFGVDRKPGTQDDIWPN